MHGSRSATGITAAVAVAARERAEELVVGLLDVEQHLRGRSGSRSLGGISECLEGKRRTTNRTERTCLLCSSVISSLALSALSVISLSPTDVGSVGGSLSNQDDDDDGPM